MFLALFVLATLLEVASFFHSNGRVKSLLNELIGTPNTHAYIHTHTHTVTGLRVRILDQTIMMYTVFQHLCQNWLK